MTDSEPALMRSDARRAILATLLVLLVTIPTLALEEDWHGRPMIDQQTTLWVIPFALVGVAFLSAGAFVGWRRPGTAFAHAVLVVVAADFVLLVAALVRRLAFVHNGVTLRVFALWVIAGLSTFAACMFGALVSTKLSRS